MRKLTLPEACAIYVHRFTMDHVPNWARQKREDGTYYAPQFKSDQEWYEHTLFPGEEGYPFGRADKRCYTRGQTWPLGLALPAPFQPRR